MTYVVKISLSLLAIGLALPRLAAAAEIIKTGNARVVVQFDRDSDDTFENGDQLDFLNNGKVVGQIVILKMLDGDRFLARILSGQPQLKDTIARKAPQGMVAATALPPETVSAIQFTNKLFLETVARKDAKALADFYSDEATLIYGNEPIVFGKKKIESVYASRLTQGWASMTNEIRKMAPLGRDAVYTVSVWTASSGPIEKAQVIAKGNATAVWVRRNGKWLMYVGALIP